MLSFGAGVHEFVLKSEGFELKKENVMVEKDGKYFAPGNLRATKNEEWYSKLVNFWMDSQYTLRYSGGMAPDINHILVKGKGIFTYPGYENSPDGKLRLLYECGPMSYLMEQAGGKSMDGNISVLDKKIEALHQRTPIFIGSCNEVDLALKYLHDFKKE
jgi:fructose-1,6-bisphosphatase